MPLTQEEELELKKLEEEQKSLIQEYNLLKEELAPKPETGLVESTVRGIAQGLTFDMADEAIARAESTLTGKPYEEALKESRSKFKAAEEEYPIASTLGQIGGGIAQGIGLAAATGGIGTTGAVASTGSKLAKLGKLAKAALIPSTSKSVAKNIGTAALSGATYGGLQEYGQSEKEGKEALEEVPMAVITGGVVGGGLGAGIEGAKKIGKVVTKTVNKIMDEGDLPRSFEKVRDLYRSGLQGKGYIASKEAKRIEDELEKAAESGIDVVQGTLDDVRNIKKTILAGVDKPIEIKPTIDNLKNTLNSRMQAGFSDASKVLNELDFQISKKMKPESGAISALATDDLIGKLEDFYQTNPEIKGEVKEALKEGINELKLNLRLSTDPDDVMKILKDKPEVLKKYNEYVQSLSDDVLETSDVLSEYEKKFFSGLKKSATAQKKKAQKAGIKTDVELEETLKKLKKGRPGATQEEKLKKAVDKMSEEDIGMILEEGKSILKEKSRMKPLGQLDTVMHHILNASSSLGGITRSKTNPLKRKFKLFDILTGNTAETGTGQKAAMKYEDAINELAKANPKVAKLFREVTEPAITELDNRKFLQGGNIYEGARDTSALRQFISAPAVATGLAANLLAQASQSKVAKSTLRPTISYLQNVKSKIDDAIVTDPDNKLLVKLSQGIDEALSSKDETRRAAILNTLMQYESIRKLFKENEETK